MNENTFPKGRTAFLVIHGIGEQNPYETLDGFSRGMYSLLNARDATMQVEHRMAARQDPGGPWTEHFVRLKSESGADYVDIHEFYWAYLTEEKISVSEVFAWAMKTLEATKTFYRENKELGEKYEGKFRFRRVARMLCWMRLLYPFLAVLPALLSLIPIAGPRWLSGATDWVKNRAASILTGYIGDIAIYTTADEKSQYFAIRRNILNRCQSLLEELLGDQYDRVIVAGHSLGSVIGYDTLNRLNIKANLEDGGRLGLQRLRGLVTFGSPLDKTAFFFREHAGKEQVFRRRILEHLHSFKARNLDLAGNNLQMQDPIGSRLSHVTWVNYFNLLDPVSGNLDYYDVDENVKMELPGPWGVAHVQYWDDRKFFYQDIARRFLD